MKRYYVESINGKVTIFEIDHDKRAAFWTEHPRAEEIDKETYDSLIAMCSKDGKLMFYQKEPE